MAEARAASGTKTPASASHAAVHAFHAASLCFVLLSLIDRGANGFQTAARLTKLPVRESRYSRWQEHACAHSGLPVTPITNTATTVDTPGDSRLINAGTKSNGESNNSAPNPLSIRKLWRRRHARSLEEGIRREKTIQLSSLLNKFQRVTPLSEERAYSERIIMGLINALAGEVEGLDVEIDTRPDTPLWRKEINEVRIFFNRLGFKQLQMGGYKIPEPGGGSDGAYSLSLVETADEAFDRLDADNSGALDSEEIALALDKLSAPDFPSKMTIDALAEDLVELYDQNGDGVVDREEYQMMIEDMAALKRERPKNNEGTKVKPKEDFLAKVTKLANMFSQGVKEKAAENASLLSAKFSSMDNENKEKTEERDYVGSIVFSGLKLDMRRLAFGAVPIVKRVTPGGPLVLEPFKMTVAASFNREDVLSSFLLDTGLRLLVARALRVRLRTFRDIVDGAFFVGRRWKLFSKSAPVVDILELSNVEFDTKNKMVITGRARVRASPDSPIVTNTFKVRTKFGTKRDGQSIRLVEPELAFVFECPENWSDSLKIVCEWLSLPTPGKPAPLYAFFPIYSPFKVDDNAGFDMGDDNRLKSIDIKDGALRFEMSAVLRPGRFLGSHYLAFTIPNRTFIVTLDRVREGIRNARKNKKIAALEKSLEMEETAIAMKNLNFRPTRMSGTKALRQRVIQTSPKLKEKRPQPKSFFARFVEGYSYSSGDRDTADKDLANALSDWFGRQI